MNEMNRDRFVELLAAYGADMNRWPASERAAAEAFAAQSGGSVAAEIAAARALDAALDADAGPARDYALLEARILKSAPRAGGGGTNRGAIMLLAACAVFGVLLGYGGGRLVPEPVMAETDEDYLAMAFETPFDAGEGG